MTTAAADATLPAARRGESAGLLDRLNPVSRVLGLLIWTTPLVLTIDWVSAAVALACAVLMIPLSGISPLMVLRRAWPLLVAAPISGISMALYGAPEGELYASFLLAHVTDNSLQLGLAIFLRVLAIGLPVIVLTAGVDPTDLGDGLAQVLRLPARFVLAAMAGVRLVTLFIDDWRALTRARRARGLGDSGRLRRVASQVFALLVFALRRGAKLSTAMEARGFGAPGPRTWGRESRLHAGDWALMAVCACFAALALGVSAWLGHFRFLGM
ncbi:energy-coupling factor transporter transmembrane component T family protein [Corynebacterium sp. 335C]